jgi:hypothetical protein
MLSHASLQSKGCNARKENRFSRTFEKIIGSSAVRFPIHAIAGLKARLERPLFIQPPGQK